MKNTSIIALVLFLIPFYTVNQAFSQKPEKVYSFVKVDKPFDWFINQAELWKKAIDSDTRNADAWLNFYAANRMASRIDFDAWQKKKGPGFMELNEIVLKMEKAVPGSYEYYDVRTWNDGYQNEDNAGLILKAYAMAPERTEIYSSLVNYFEMKRDHEHEAEICRKWFDSNDLSPNLLNYNYNVLMSLDDNGIVITNGDNDTYPLWILQYALGIKKNVVVVNINMVTVDSYRKKLFEENGIPADGLRAQENPSQEMIIRHLITSSGRPVYFANTLSTGYYEPFKENLYMIGLVFKYAKESFDNLAVIRNNYERNYLMDYLKVRFNKDISEGIINRMNMGYMPFLIKLYEHYSLAGEQEKAGGVRNLALLIGQKGDPDVKVEDWFKKD